MKYITNSPEETQNLAKLIATDFKKGGVVALIGELGAGKTTFTQGFAKSLGITDKVISPTFVLMRIHPLNNKQKLFHLDLYRLEGKIDLKEIGLEEIISNPENIVLIEWAEKIIDQLPENVTKVEIKKLPSEMREVSVS